jgi:hypothetical protein
MLGVGAAIAKLAFVGLVVAAIVSGELRRWTVAVIVALGVTAWFGLPYLTRGSDFVTPALAMIDVVLVFTIFKGDIRIP